MSLETPVVVSIRLNETGEIRQHSTSVMNYENGSPCTYMWEEGNFSCDCNRGIFWWEAGEDENEVEPELEELCCGDTKYSVSIATTDGTIIYNEFVTSSLQS